MQITWKGENSYVWGRGSHEEEEEGVVEKREEKVNCKNICVEKCCLLQ
jgi:hypothetical protein